MESRRHFARSDGDFPSCSAFPDRAVHCTNKAYTAWLALASEMERWGWVIEKDYPTKMAQMCKKKRE